MNKELEDVLEIQQVKPYYDNVIAFRPILVDITGGDLIAGLLLSQIAYWYLPPNGSNKPTRLSLKQHGHYWLAKNRKDWWDEIRISKAQYRRAIKKLKKLGIVEVLDSSFQGKRTPWIRIVPEVFIKLLEDLQEQSG